MNPLCFSVSTSLCNLLTHIVYLRPNSMASYEFMCYAKAVVTMSFIDGNYANLSGRKPKRNGRDSPQLHSSASIFEQDIDYSLNCPTRRIMQNNWVLSCSIFINVLDLISISVLY